MKYIKVGTWFVADPATWQELSFTLNHQSPFLDFDPSNVVVTSADKDALATWLK